MSGLDDHAFLVQDDIREGESGHGYVLRMASANLLSGLPAVKAMLRKSRFTVLEADDAASIARWFGGREHRIARALGRTAIGTQAEVYEFCGSALTRSTFINRGQPRICPACLADGGVCWAAWEISANVACSRHGVLLISECSGCGSALRWDRPHLVQCSCGWSLLMATPEHCSEVELDLAAWVEEHFGSMHAGVGSTQVGRLLSPLGLDAGLHVLCALGATQERVGRAVPVEPAARKRNSMVTARQCIESAQVALEIVRKGATLPKKIRLSLAARQLLADAAAGAYLPSERQLALSLLAALGHLNSKSRWSGRNPQLSQMELF